ncbi:MAG: hypothetical protein ACXW1W_17695 [Methylococcaceae bacterium]
MAISEQQRQKKLAKKKQKRGTTNRKITPSMKKAKPYASYPIHECLIPDNLFTSGIGELVVTRRISNGDIAMSAFVIDVFCLGVKDAMFMVLPESEYEHRIKGRMSATGDRGFEKLHQSCAKKLLDGVVDYAKEFGFNPHPDYKNANELFGNIDASVCPVKYTYGKEGKPFYMSGPYESPTDIQRILNTLTEKCGAGGFNTIIRLTDGMDDDFM